MNADLAFASVIEQGVLFETGTPVTFRFLRNTEKSGYFGSTYQQDIEPAGRYMIHNADPGQVARGWETGVVSFENPLVILLTTGDEIYGPLGWKARLRDVFGETGVDLSHRLLAEGWDGIVTVGEFTHRGRTTRDTREIVDLRPLLESNPRRHERARLLGVPKCSVRDCGRDHYARGWCMRHYMAQRLRGRLRRDLQRDDLAKDVRLCRAKHCTRDAVVNRLCRKHAVQVKVHGRLTPERELGVERVCEVRRCRRPHVARGLCMQHYNEKVRRNTPDAEDCQKIQDWLFDYLSTDIDPYDFPRDYVQDWARDAGLEEIADDHESSADSLTKEQLAEYTKWLHESDAKYRWLDEDPVGSAPYLTLKYPKKMPPGTWCVHFTDAEPFDSFDRGATLDGLHLTRCGNDRTKVFVECPKNLDFEHVGSHEMVFGFAFRASNFYGRSYGPFRHKQKKYGETALLFRVDCAVEAYHTGDNEEQVIFPLCAEYDVTAFGMRADGSVWTDVRPDGEEGEKLFPSLLELTWSLGS